MARYITILGVVVVCFFAVQAMLVWAVDPAGMLRGKERDDWHVWEQRWRHAGLIRGAEAEVILFGTSMSENVREESLAPDDPLAALNLAFSGSSLAEQAIVARFALAYHEPRQVLWELHLGLWDRREKPTMHAWLYRDDALSRTQYLFSGEALSLALEGAARQALPLSSAGPFDAGEMNRWDPGPYEFGVRQVVEALCRIRGRLPGTDPDGLRSKAEDVLLPIVRAHPRTAFVFYFPAFSSARYWSYTPDGLQRMLSGHAAVAHVLAREPNVSFVSFLEAPFTTDWTQYRDLDHHRARKNAWEIRQIRAGRRDSPAEMEAQFDRLMAQAPAFEDQVRRAVPSDCFARLAGA